MAALDFPDTPAVGDFYGAWKWDGFRWVASVGASGPRGRVAYAEVVSSQGPITSETNLTGLSVSPTLTAGRSYLVTGHVGHMNTTANEWTRLYVRRDGVQIARAEDQTGTNTPSAIAILHAQVMVTPTVTGATTIALALRQSLTGQTGSTTAYASSDSPSFILVEDVTYEAGTSGAGFEPSSWMPITFQNGWSNYGGVQQVAQIRKQGDMVTLRGQVKGTTDRTIMTTLPVGFRPPGNLNYTAANWNGTAVVNSMLVITTAGDVVPYTNSLTDLSFFVQFSVTA